MREFVVEFKRVREKFKNNLKVVTNEVLQCDISNEQPVLDSELFYDGCSAGLFTFDVLQNGDMTPCPMFQERILNTFTCTDFEETYTKSDVIKKLIKKQFLGKCGACKIKMLCGGCRVRSYFAYEDYFNEDPLCFKVGI
ncbi:MAG: SPASM domain-containing protein [Lachnospirales bacterium]